MSGYLLDTCTLIWLADGSPSLSNTAKDSLYSDDPVFLSVVSVWEIATKHVAGKLPLPSPPDQLLPKLREGYDLVTLPIDEESALRSAALPPIHQDPFDRMLVAQAVTYGLTLLTPDDYIRQYAVRTLW